MDRTRQAILDGAADAIEALGARTTTMAEIASRSGVAKATLYNHFRTRAEVYASLAAREVHTLAALFRDAESIETGMHRAAEWLAIHPLVRVLVGNEPDLVAWLVDEERAPALWQVVRQAIGDRLGAYPTAAPADVVLRWLASFITAPGSVELRKGGAALLAAGCSSALRLDDV